MAIIIVTFLLLIVAAAMIALLILGINALTGYYYFFINAKETVNNINKIAKDIEVIKQIKEEEISK
jgi:hypothetical protein